MVELFKRRRDIELKMKQFGSRNFKKEAMKTKSLKRPLEMKWNFAVSTVFIKITQCEMRARHLSFLRRSRLPRNNEMA